MGIKFRECHKGNEKLFAFFSECGLSNNNNVLNEFSSEEQVTSWKRENNLDECIYSVDGYRSASALSVHFHFFIHFITIRHLFCTQHIDKTTDNISIIIIHKIKSLSQAFFFSFYFSRTLARCPFIKLALRFSASFRLLFLSFLSSFFI